MNDVLDTSWKKAIELETRVAEIIQRQQEHGWKLNTDLVKTHIATLDGMTKEIEDELYSKLPIRRITIPNPTVETPFKKDGTLKQRIVDYSELVRGPFSKVEWQRINLDSEDQIKEFLLSVGWKPTEWNFSKKTGEQTSPKLTEDSFEGMKDQAGVLISKRLTIVHRRRQLQGFLDNVRPDGRIEARANTIRTNTCRMGQTNVVNVPKNKSYVFFGRQMREVFTVPENCLEIGIDAKGLENRILAHYMNEPEMNRIVTSKDGLHAALLEVLEPYCPNIDNVKTLEYAFFFGARDQKLGYIAGKRPIGWSDTSMGADIRARILGRIPNLDRLITRVEAAAKRGYLYGLDGRKLFIRRGKSPLNLLIQGGGAVAMKQALVYLYDDIQRDKLNCHLIGSFHDEFCLESIKKDVDRVVILCYDCLPQVTKYFNLNCPLESDVKVGHNWAECH